MFFVADVQAAAVLGRVRCFDQELIEHHFAQRVGRTKPAGDHAHRPIAVAGERGLHDGKIEHDRTDGDRAKRR